MLEDFGICFIIIINVFRTSLLCIIMLQFKMNHKRTRVLLTHVKDRKHSSSKCVFCLSFVFNIRFYIYKMVQYYYNTIFYKNTMSKHLCYQKSSLVWGIFPSFIHELFCHIWLGSNQMQLRFLEGQKKCISACCCGWMKGTICFSLSCVSFGVFSAKKDIIQLDIEIIGWCKMWLIQMSLHSESCHSSMKVSLTKELKHSPNMGKQVHHISSYD